MSISSGFSFTWSHILHIEAGLAVGVIISMRDVLTGVRILDLSSVIAGPFATQMLSDLGADVVKVEAPKGDSVRNTGVGRSAGMSGMFLNNNRGKRSICLDLKTTAGLGAFRKLVAACDVFVHNVRSAAMGRLGLSFEDLKALNPTIIHVHIVGYGQDGPYGGLPAYDDMIQAAVALPALAVRSGNARPSYVPLAIADRVASYAAANAILAAIIKRTRDGTSQDIEIPMFEAMAQLVLADHLAGRTFVPPAGEAGYERLLSSERQPFVTSDGVICALIYNDSNWRDFLKLAGREELFHADRRFGSTSERVKHIDELYAFAAGIFRTRTTAEWLTLLRESDIPAMPYISLDDLCEDPHLLATGTIRQSRHPTEGDILEVQAPAHWRGDHSRGQRARPAPHLGEHGREVLAEIGVSDQDVEQLITMGGLKVPVRGASCGSL